MLASSDDAGETWKVRRKSWKARLETIEDTPVLMSEWRPWPDVVIDTYLLPPTEDTPNWHLRLHHITSGGRTLTTSDGAFALNGVATKDERGLQAMDGKKERGQARG